MIRPDLRDFINRHKPIDRLNNNTDNNNNNNNDTDNTNNTNNINNINNNNDENNNNNNDNNNNNNNTDTNNNTDIKYISTKSFNETRTVHPKSRQVEVYIGSDTEYVIDTLFNTLLQNFQLIQETSNERWIAFIPDSVELLEYKRHKIDIIRAESYIITPDWIANKKATINPKNEKDNKCFQWSIIAGLNYNSIKRVDTDFSSHQRYWENFEQENNSIAINVLFASHNSEEIKLTYKSSYNKRKNQVILLMINDEANNCYHFAIKNLSELNSLGWLRCKKESIINNNDNNNNNFQNALDDALNYQTIETHPERISKLKPYINKYNWEGINFPAGSKEWQKFERNNDTIALNILYVKHNTKK